MPAAKQGKEGRSWLGKTSLEHQPQWAERFYSWEDKRIEPQGQELMPGSSRAQRPLLGGLMWGAGVVRLTLTCLSSAVVSSNSSPSLKLISVLLKVLWVFTVILSPSISMMVVGLVSPAICRVAKPTPVGAASDGGLRVRGGGRMRPSSSGLCQHHPGVLPPP